MCMSEAPVHPGFASGKNFHDRSLFHFTSYFKQKTKKHNQPKCQIPTMDKYKPPGMDSACT